MRASLVLSLLVPSLTACTDLPTAARLPAERDSLFERTDRVFTDDDDDPRCFDPVDGDNNSIDGQLTRGLRQEIAAADCPGGTDTDAGLLDCVGQNQQGHPFADAPLQGGELCSPISKLVAGGYYAATGTPATMGEWCVRYGLAPDCQTSDLADALTAPDGPRDLQVSYFNAHALPVFRITLCNDVEGPGFACVNLNYICPERVPGGIRQGIGADGIPLRDALCDPVESDCNACEAVSVTMHYDRPRDLDGEPIPGTRPIVVFAAYRGVGPDAPLMDRIDLDFSGTEEPHETVPHICNNCHGGVPYAPLDPRAPTLDELDMGSQFLPINPRYALRDKDVLFDYLDGRLPFADALMRAASANPRAELAAVTDALRAAIAAGEPSPSSFGVDPTTRRSDGRQAFRTDFVGDLRVIPGQPARLDLSGDLEDTRRINELILAADASPGNATVLGAIDDNLDAAEYPELHLARELPPDWERAGVAADDYRLVAEHCTDSCHLGLDGEVDFQRFDDFVAYRDTTLFDVCRDYSMPQSPESFNLFWSKSARVGEASRGDDVEALLTLDLGRAWPPLIDAGALDDACPIPPLVFGAALLQPEFTSPQVLRSKARACRAELAAEGGRADIDAPLLRNCRAICGAAVLDSGFEQSAAITARTCEDLVAEGLDGVDGERLSALRAVRERAGRVAWADDVARVR